MMLYRVIFEHEIESTGFPGWDNVGEVIIRYWKVRKGE